MNSANSKIFTLPEGTPMTSELLGEFIGYHKQLVSTNYQRLQNAYCNDYKIFTGPKKEDYKPDNRISVNFAKFITDTMNGFFIGNPVRISNNAETEADQAKINDFIQAMDSYNDLDDHNAELSKWASVYGHAYEYYFIDEREKIGIAVVSPMQAFMVYTDGVVPEPLYFVRYYTDYENIERGEFCSSQIIQSFNLDSGCAFDGPERAHGFNGVPATEFLENAERIGIFESALPAIDAYNKALSEKANEVDYFSDSYLAIIGAPVDDKGLRFIRDNRVINFPDSDLDRVQVEFLERPSGDTTQENLLNRLEEKIYQTSMVTNITDDSFGTSSGAALKLKLRPMINLARTKERKFTSGLYRRYRLLFSNAYSGMQEDAWLSLQFKFSFDIPTNLADEAQTARNLVGIVSEETILKTLSCVDDVKKETEQLEEDRQREDLSTLPESEHFHDHVTEA